MNLLVEVVVRKSFIKLKFTPTKKKPTPKPPSYYASLVRFGDILNSSGVVAEAVIREEEVESFKREFLRCLQQVKKTLEKTLREDGYGL